MTETQLDKYIVERTIKIYDPDGGSIELSPNSDVEDLVTIKSYCGAELEREISMTKESIILLAAEVLLEYLDDRAFFITLARKLSQRLGANKKDQK